MRSTEKLDLEASDLRLVSRARSRIDPPCASFEQIFQVYAPYVLRVLPRMGISAADREDVAQEVFLAIHRSLPSFEGRSSLKSWIYGICIRVCSNHRGRAFRRHERLSERSVEERDERTPQRAAAGKQALAMLDCALAGLSEAQRAVFVLHEIEGLSMAEIAQALGCSRFTAYGRLYAARRAIEAYMAMEARQLGGGDG